jgi:K+-transporting ATPase KdpF subunit
MLSFAIAFGEGAMSLESTIMLGISALATLYLVYALLRPEKF